MAFSLTAFGSHLRVLSKVFTLHKVIYVLIGSFCLLSGEEHVNGGYGVGDKVGIGDTRQEVFLIAGIMKLVIKV